MLYPQYQTNVSLWPYSWMKQGDSGGPLVLNNKVVGVVNFGPIPCGNGYPDGFANVAYLYDWIKSNTQEN